MKYIFLGALASAAIAAAPVRKAIGPKLSEAALAQTREHVVYDPAYYRIPYPNGDVPAGRGVCTDVIIRAYRAQNIDLQKEVHEDITKAPSAYPRRRYWRKKPDTNIDHRRVPNLMVFFARKGAEIPVTRNVADYKPGDVVAWDLGRGVLHIGLVVDRKSLPAGRPQVVHNIGAGPKLEDVLFHWRIIGHYRFSGPQ